MISKAIRITVFFLLIMVPLSSCRGTIPITGEDLTGEATTTAVDSVKGAQVIGKVSNIKTQVHAGAHDDLKLIEGEAELGNDDFVSVTDGGKARMEFPGPINLLLFNQSEMDGIKLEYDANSNPLIRNRL